MNKNTIILSIASIAILFGLIAYGSMQMKQPPVVSPESQYVNTDRDSVPDSRPEPQSPEQREEEIGIVACTMEAKQCPDGTYVGRQGPRCEFAPCPGN